MRLPNLLGNGSRALQGFVTGTGLKARVMRGSAMMGFGSVVEHAIRFLRNLILTRILLPEALGTMAIILAINAALESFTEVGVREAVIQNPKGEHPAFLNAAWWFATARGALLCTVGLALAWPLAHFYRISEARTMLMISFTAILCNGAISSRAYIALKHLEYGRWVVIMVGSALGGIGVTLVLLWQLGDIRALVYGYVCESLLKLILSFLLCPFRPSLTFRAQQTRELLRFARGMAGVPFLTFVFLSADIFVLGKVVDKGSLGLYGVAASLASAPTVLISIFINPILMPVIAHIRQQPSRINGVLLTITRTMAMTGSLLCAWVALFASDIMRIVYGPAYAAVGFVLAILLFSAFIRTLASPIPAIYLGLGEPSLNRVFAALRTGVLVILIYPAAIRFGLAGVAWAGVISMTIAWVFQIRQLSALTQLDIREYSRSLGIGFASGAIIWVGAVCVRMIYPGSLPAFCAASFLTAAVAMLAGPRLVRELRHA